MCIFRWYLFIMTIYFFGLVGFGLVVSGWWVRASGFRACDFRACGFRADGFRASGFGLVGFGLMTFGLVGFGLVTFGLVSTNEKAFTSPTMTETSVGIDSEPSIADYSWLTKGPKVLLLISWEYYRLSVRIGFASLSNLSFMKFLGKKNHEFLCELTYDVSVMRAMKAVIYCHWKDPKPAFRSPESN